MIHQDSMIDPDVRIGARTKVWEQARIREGASIGTDCVVGRGAYIDVGVTIGDRVKVQNNALLYHGVSVASSVFVGPGAIVTNDRMPRSVTARGSLAGAGEWTLTTTRLEEGSSIGAGAIVVAGNHIGRWATVGAGAVVTHVVPDHALVAGNPARRLGWVCRCGQRLVDQDDQPHAASAAGEAVCPECRRTYVINGDDCQETPTWGTR